MRLSTKLATKSLCQRQQASINSPPLVFRLLIAHRREGICAVGASARPSQTNKPLRDVRTARSPSFDSSETLGQSRLTL